MTVTYHPPEPADLAHIAANMRAADIAEMQATLPVTPLEGLRRSVIMSHESCVARVDGVPACVFGLGVGSYLSGLMRPWLFGTNAVEANGRIFLRSNRVVVNDWASRFDLENYVDARHTVSVRWLRWLGFMLDDAKPFGPFGFEFHRFEMRRHVSAAMESA